MYISMSYSYCRMDIPVFEQLHKEELIDRDALAAIKAREKERIVSVHWDLRTLVYFSILLFTTGLGILLYKNIDTIGHATLVTLAGLLAAVCMGYCFKVAAPYTPSQSVSPNLWFDYTLLLGCLLMLAFVGYLQYQYHVFGMQWGLATFIPMLFLFYCAYFFDHKGVLSMAITNLGAWMGIAVAPLKLVKAFDADKNIIINGVVLGLLLHLLSWLSGRFNVKAHFASVYKNFGVHVLFISLIAAMFQFDDWYFLWFIALAGAAAFHIINAFARSSLYFLVCSVLYGYVGASYVVVRLLFKMDGAGGFPIYFMQLYFIGSAVGLVFLLIHFNRRLKNNDSVQ